MPDEDELPTQMELQKKYTIKLIQQYCSLRRKYHHIDPFILLAMIQE